MNTSTTGSNELQGQSFTRDFAMFCVGKTVRLEIARKDAAGMHRGYGPGDQRYTIHRQANEAFALIANGRDCGQVFGVQPVYTEGGVR